MAIDRRISFRTRVGAILDVGYHLHVSGRQLRPGLWRACHEIVVELCCAVSRRYFVNCIAERTEQYGHVTNHNRLRRAASQHLGRSAEAGGEANHAEADDARGYISQEIGNRSNAIGCARLGIRKNCQA